MNSVEMNSIGDRNRKESLQQRVEEGTRACGLLSSLRSLCVQMSFLYQLVAWVKHATLVATRVF